MGTFWNAGILTQRALIRSLLCVLRLHLAVQSNQWLVAKSGGLEVIASAMRGWREYPMVQLCALLCMVPLALDNTVLQVRAPAAV